MKHQLTIAFLLLAMLFSCTKDPAQPSDQNPPTDDVNMFLTELPAWSEFSPLKAPVPPTATDSSEKLPDVTMDVEAIGDSGEVTIIPNVTYECISTPYTVTDNPQQIVMYSPDIDVLWPGSLIQGKSYANGLGSLLGITIAERSPIDVSIPGLANNDNFRTVDLPSQSTVAQAIGSMVGNATAESLATPSTISFKQEVYHSEKSFGLSVGLSGNYMGFSASASGDFSRDASETTITAHFYQKMFEVVVAPPQTPGAFFSEDFTEAKLQEQINLGRIGNDNIPVYVANVVYGRMMMFSMTSTASETDMRATLNAAYNGIGGGGSASLSAKQSSILQQSKIAITSLGGDAEATISMIRSGDWSQYFTNSAPLTSAAPLSYTFKNLGDGSIAKVSEATDFNITECQAKVAIPGTFNFLPEESMALSIPTPATTLQGDFNGDGKGDFVFNHLSGTSNETVVALSDGNGSFSMSSPVSHPAAPTETWGIFDLLVGDFDGDGSDDLVWNLTDAKNRTYVALSNGDGSFDFKDEVEHPNGGWSNYLALIGDVDGDNKDDLVWNYVYSSGNRTYVGLSNGDGTLNLLPFQDRGGNGWQAYIPFLTDISGDSRADICWNVLDNRNAMHGGIANSNGTFSFYNAQLHQNNGWGNFTNRMGDINGDLMSDYVWSSFYMSGTTPRIRIYTGPSNGNGTFATSATPFDLDLEEAGGDVHLADVNGDGKKDIILNHLDTINRTYVGLSINDDFDFSRVNQLHPEVTDWSQYQLFSGDFDNDDLDDLVWIFTGSNTKIFVALAKE
ncbi:MAG: thiol-activated cytolysin family protein [Calditrichia bacterium]